MFDFFFKRPVKKPSGPSVTEEKSEADRRAASTLGKQQAILQAESLTGKESAAADFILQCEFADARLKAAQHIESRPQIERVAQAMRNTDRRVAKLMQQRLDALRLRELNEDRANQCLQEAQRLAEEPQLMLNQVANLDRIWQSTGEISASVRDAFVNSRAILQDRLEQQTSLQRKALDVRTRLQQLMQTVTDTPDLLPPSEIEQAMNALEQEMAQHCSAPEASSLPKNLLIEFESQHRGFRQTLQSLEKRQSAIAAYEHALTRWETAPADTLSEDALKRAWRLMPVLQDDDAQGFNARFDALADRTRQLSKPQKSVQNEEVKQDNLQYFIDTMENLEKALAEGALQTAVEHDKALRAIDPQSVRLTNAHTAQLAKARSELGRLQGWAKWGGNVSREELAKAAEELPDQDLAVAELAKKVGSLRARWKSMDVSAGPASKVLWLRFDTACTVAYAPVAENSKKLADERQQNLVKAQAIIAEVREFVLASHCSDTDSANVDWKAVANYCHRTTLLWQRLGPIDRREKKLADTEFSAALSGLSAPLSVQQQLEIKQRQAMIAEAGNLNPAERNTVDRLRSLQERWQERAKSLPLERKDEQALWQEFRGACDSLFAKRKEATQTADAERQQNLQAKEDLCATLEAAANVPQDAIATAIRDAHETWKKIGSVPHASERLIESRFQVSLAALQSRLDAVQRSASAAQFDVLRDKLALCREVEEKIVGDGTADSGELDRLQADWQDLPALSPDFEKVLRSRFEAAVATLQSADPLYAGLIEQHRAVLAQDVLRLEILLGIDSPAELSRERLQLQVEVLQSSLKAGQKPVTPKTQLLQLCGLPALMDQAIGKRIDQVLAGFKDMQH